MSTTQWQWFLTCSITVIKNRPPLKFILPSILVCVVRAERWPFSCVLFIFLHVECRTSLAESFVSEWNVDVFPTLNCMVTLGQRKSTVTNSPPQGVAPTALELSHLCHQQPVQQFNSRTVKPASSHFINVGKCSLSSPSLLFTIYLNLLCPCTFSRNCNLSYVLSLLFSVAKAIQWSGISLSRTLLDWSLSFQPMFCQLLQHKID